MRDIALPTIYRAKLIIRQTTAAKTYGFLGIMLIITGIFGIIGIARYLSYFIKSTSRSSYVFDSGAFAWALIILIANFLIGIFLIKLYRRICARGF